MQQDKTVQCHGSWRIAAAFVCGLAAAPAFAASGEQWEFSGAMEMMGMKMPMPAVKVCLAPGKEVPPSDGQCTYSDVKHQGVKTTYRVECAGSPPMSGTGELTRKGDRIDSVAKFKTAQGDSVLQQSGKLIGACELAQ